MSNADGGPKSRFASRFSIQDSPKRRSGAWCVWVLSLSAFDSEQENDRGDAEPAVELELSIEGEVDVEFGDEWIEVLLVAGDALSADHYVESLGDEVAKKAAEHGEHHGVFADVADFAVGGVEDEPFVAEDAFHAFAFERADDFSLRCEDVVGGGAGAPRTGFAGEYGGRHGFNGINRDGLFEFEGFLTNEKAQVFLGAVDVKLLAEKGKYFLARHVTVAFKTGQCGGCVGLWLLWRW